MLACARLSRLRAPPPLRARPSTASALSARVAALLARHAELSAQLSTGSVPARDLPRLSRELSSLEFVAGPGGAAAAHAALAREASDLAALAASDGEGELGALARAELSERVAPALAAAEASLARALAPADEADGRDAVLEVRAGTGGDEAALFAGELLAAYAAYAASRGWSWSPLSAARDGGGGLREAAVAVGGAGAYGRLRHESGVHRVQRVPVTESAGRLHTSTAAVVVLADADEVEVELRPADLRLDTFRASGAGGQHVNTTDSAVRITHVPTGTVVTCQDERSQHQNKARAMRVLRARLFDAQRERAEAARQSERRAQVGRADRSERVRTYNFAQNRVTDHRVALTRHDCAAMMRGEILDEFIDALAEREVEARLAADAAEPGR